MTFRIEYYLITLPAQTICGVVVERDASAFSAVGVTCKYPQGLPQSRQGPARKRAGLFVGPPIAQDAAQHGSHPRRQS